MKKVTVLVVIWGIFLFGLKYLYRGSVDSNLVFMMALIITPLIAAIFTGKLLLKESNGLVLNFFSFCLVVIVSGVTFLFMTFGYLWSFEEGIKEKSIENIVVTDDITIDINKTKYIRSTREDVSIKMKYKDIETKIDSFSTNRNINLVVDKATTIENYKLYIIRYTYCYDFKDSKYTDAIIPLVLDSEGMPLYLLNGKEYKPERAYSDESDGLNYIKDEELKRAIYLKEIEEKNNKLFYENAKNYLNDEDNK